MLKVLQVCNAGQITGGTGACVWSILRAIPECGHEVICLGHPSREMERVLSPVRIRCVASNLEEEISKSRADVILLHNISRRKLKTAGDVPTLNYLHSRIDPAPSHYSVACSEWLANQYPGKIPVLWQGVPRAIRPREGESGFRGRRELRSELVVGRLCTPVARKWWSGISEFYKRLSWRLPSIRWEFVGCPRELRRPLTEACQEKVRFLEAGWNVRSCLWNWDALLYHHPELPESFGRTVAEGLRAGCIPVVDHQGGFIEQLRGGAGFLCENEGEFASALVRLQDVAERRKFSQACRVRGDQYFSLGSFRKRLMSVLLTLIERSSRNVSGSSARPDGNDRFPGTRIDPGL